MSADPLDSGLFDPDAVPERASDARAEDSMGAGFDAARGADPGEPGAYGVTQEDVTIPGPKGKIAATVYAPVGDSASWPLVVVSPGFQMPRSQYASYGQHLASWGLVAVVQDFPGGFSTSHADLALQVTAVLDWALASDRGLSVAKDQIGAAGHSLGGKVSLLAATGDVRVRAVVGWDPVDTGSPSVAPERMADLHAAVCVLGETTNATGGFMPCAPEGDNFQSYYASATSSALEVTVEDADHMDWVDDPSCVLCGLCTPSGKASEEVVQRVTRRITVAWLRRHLLGERRMDTYLSGEAMQEQVRAGVVSVQAK
jgi:hypothetical protein